MDSTLKSWTFSVSKEGLSCSCSVLKPIIIWNSIWDWCFRVIATIAEVQSWDRTPCFVWADMIPSVGTSSLIFVGMSEEYLSRKIGWLAADSSEAETRLSHNLSLKSRRTGHVSIDSIFTSSSTILPGLNAVEADAEKSRLESSPRPGNNTTLIHSKCTLTHTEGVIQQSLQVSTFSSLMVMLRFGDLRHISSKRIAKDFASVEISYPLWNL